MKKYYQKLIDKIKHTYWSIVPYDYRPHNLWYSFKCWAWHRYTTTKPRYLPHTWCDKCCVLPHTIFEIIADFVESECSPGVVDWYASDHRIVVNGQDKNVRDELQDLYDWWTSIDHNNWPEIYDNELREKWFKLHKQTNQMMDTTEKPILDDDGNIIAYEWKSNMSEKDKPVFHELMKQIQEIEKEDSKELINKMHRACNIYQYLWT